MTCPKCQGEMRHYERSGVTIDQCTECRGIFLDRGELEKLIDAEARWAEAQQRPPDAQPTPAAPPAGTYVPPPPPPQPAYPTPAYGHYGYHGHYRRKRHRGFLGELFD